MIGLRTIFFILGIIISTTNIYGQENQGFSGTEFWVTFGSNVVPQDDTTLHIIIVASSNDTVEVKNPITGATVIATVKANIPKRVSFISKEVWQCWAKNNDKPVGGPEPVAVRIRSKRDVQAFVRELRDRHDTTIVLTTANMSPYLP